jgi:phosphinothricin acetyltransferase
MAPAVTIRQAKVQDGGAIAAIYTHHVLHGTATFDTTPRSAADTQARIVECIARDWPYLVAIGEGAVIGYAYATPFRDRPAYALACENSIYVHPDHLGLGVGKKLLAALMSGAETNGFRQMIAVIGGGEPASVALHASLGFKHAGRMRSVGRKFGRWLDTVYMQIALGAGDGAPPPKEPT